MRVDRNGVKTHSLAKQSFSDAPARFPNGAWVWCKPFSDAEAALSEPSLGEDAPPMTLFSHAVSKSCARFCFERTVPAIEARKAARPRLGSDGAASTPVPEQRLV